MPDVSIDGNPVGVLRTSLALLVVGSHLSAFGGAVFAVKAFFIISGFYMALVISTRYHALPISDFYTSRFLRLLPLYWVIGLLTVAAEILLVPHGQQFHRLVSPVANMSRVDFGSLPFPILAYVLLPFFDYVRTRYRPVAWLWPGRRAIVPSAFCSQQHHGR